MAIFYFINGIVAAETIEGGETIRGNTVFRKRADETDCCIFVYVFWLGFRNVLVGYKMHLVVRLKTVNSKHMYSKL